MNEIYLQRLKEDLRLKNYAKNTREDYYRFVVRFLDFTRKDAMAVTYADIRKFVFHMMDNESKKASTINTYTAAIRFFFEYTLGHGTPPASRDVPGERDRLSSCIWNLGFFPNDARKNCPFVLTSFTGWSSERCPGMGSYQEGTGKSGSYGMWNHPRGHVWNVFVRPASS